MPRTRRARGQPGARVPAVAPRPAARAHVWPARPRRQTRLRMRLCAAVKLAATTATARDTGLRACWPRACNLGTTSSGRAFASSGDAARDAGAWPRPATGFQVPTRRGWTTPASRKAARRRSVGRLTAFVASTSSQRMSPHCLQVGRTGSRAAAMRSPATATATATATAQASATQRYAGNTSSSSSALPRSCAAATDTPARPRRAPVAAGAPADTCESLADVVATRATARSSHPVFNAIRT